MLAVVDSAGRILWANPECERTLHVSASALTGSEFLAVLGADDRFRAAAMMDKSEERWEDFVVPLPDGSRVDTAWSASRLADGAHILIGRDLTEQRRLLSRVSRTERLEMTGRLAGGVAHDFSNFLTVIAGYAQLLLQPNDRRERSRSDVEGIARAAEGARAVVKQLLAFVGREPGMPGVLDVNAAIEGLKDFVARLIGSEIAVEYELSAQSATTRLEAGQLEQIVINLLLNARDALPHGGRVWVRTESVEIPGDAAGTTALRPGRYVTLRVRDDGQGMDANTRQHLFEPFFTTKAPGQGTGLGLASVHAIVTQAGGHIELESEPERGTTFTLYLPWVDGEDVSPANLEVPAGPQRPATVLVVEDHDVIRGLCCRVLESEGHRVFEASTVQRALQIADDVPDLDLVVADVRLGGENGVDLARALKAARPSVRVLLVSGYATPRVWEAAFLAKPFTPLRLISAVRQVLGES
jgi:signal transduction histidine kinase